MNGWHRLSRGGRVTILTLLAVVLAASPLAGAEHKKEKDDRPERGIAIYTDYSGVVVPVGKAVRLDLTVQNKGKRDEKVDLKFTRVPKGWNAFLRGGTFTVTGVSVPGGETRLLTFRAEPEKGLSPGTYTFTLEGTTADGALTASHTITVRTRKQSALGAEDVEITTSYPVLRGPSDAKFEFSLDVENKSDTDRIFNLAAQAPPKWQINFKPGFASKLISSLRIRGGASQTVAVEVTPPQEARAGEYPILVQISSGKAKAESRLTVALTGTYKLDVRTPRGILSTEAVRGKPTKLSLLVRNVGSAVNRNIEFSSFKPENWEVKFTPKKIDALEPDAMKEVEVAITPAARALVGDYSVGLRADGEKANKAVEMRVTVKASTAWAWIGVGIIAAVIGGMGGLFAWLGRR
ncbi:MAG: NEW3 domain-containing protein [Candidatus Methylomirabilales bacterium]